MQRLPPQRRRRRRQQQRRQRPPAAAAAGSDARKKRRCGHSHGGDGGGNGDDGDGNGGGGGSWRASRGAGRCAGGPPPHLLPYPCTGGSVSVWWPLAARGWRHRWCFGRERASCIDDSAGGGVRGGEKGIRWGPLVSPSGRGRTGGRRQRRHRDACVCGHRDGAATWFVSTPQFPPSSRSSVRTPERIASAVFFHLLPHRPPGWSSSSPSPPAGVVRPYCWRRSSLAPPL